MSRRNKSTEDAAVITDVSVADAFSNPMYRLGYGSQAPLEATDYPLTRLTDNYALLNSLYRSEGILQSIIDIIPADMVREWFKLSGNIKPEAMDQLEREMSKLGLRDKVKEGLGWGRLYGGAAGILLIKGQEDMLDQPLDLESILPGTFKGILVLDRWSGIQPGSELITDITSAEFGMPKYYEINTDSGKHLVARVHHSRVVRFEGKALPYLEKVAEMYWGESEIEPIYDDIVLYDNIMHNMGNLTFRANIDTMEVQNLDQLFSVTSVEQQRRFWNVMQAQSVAQSNFGMRLVNKGDQVTNTQYAFTGFNYVTEAAQLNLCAKTHIPMTKLFGRSPAGMNATGESDLTNYYDIVDGEREDKLRPVIEKILPVLCMSVWGEVPEDMQVVFPPLWTPSATELAQIAKDKTDTIISTFQANLISQGTAQAELKKLSDETGMFDSITDEEIKKNQGKTFQDVTALQDPTAGLSKGSEEDNPFQTKDEMTVDGGKGSGNFGHVGRPGMVGGSGNTSGKDLTQGKLDGTIKPLVIRLPNGETIGLAEGTSISKIVVIAGSGSQKPIHDIKRLKRTYGADGFSKLRGEAFIPYNGSTARVEVHWYEAKKCGIVEMKVKRFL